MPFEISLKENTDYVRFCVSGATSLASFAGLIARIAHEIEECGCNRILVDLRQVEGRLTTAEQQRVGALAAERLPAVRLASLVPEGELTRNSERSALGQRLVLRVFDAESAALFWLLEEGA